MSETTEASSPPVAAPDFGAPKLHGEFRRHPTSSLREAFLVLTFVAALRAFFEFLARSLLRRRRVGTLELVPGEVQMTEETSLFGRVVRRRTTRLALADVLEVGSEETLGTRMLFAGLLSTALGTLVGAFVVVESARAESLGFVGVGATMIALGLALDYALTRRSFRERAPALWVRLRSGRAFRLQGVERTALEGFLRRLSPGSEGSPPPAGAPSPPAVS